MDVEVGRAAATARGPGDPGGAPDALRAALAQLAEAVIVTDVAGRFCPAYAPLITVVNGSWRASSLHDMRSSNAARHPTDSPHPPDSNASACCSGTG